MLNLTVPSCYKLKETPNLIIRLIRLIRLLLVTFRVKNCVPVIYKLFSSFSMFRQHDFLTEANVLRCSVNEDAMDIRRCQPQMTSSYQSRQIDVVESI